MSTLLHKKSLLEGRLSVFPVGDDRSCFSAILEEKMRGLSGATTTQVQSSGHIFFVQKPEVIALSLAVWDVFELLLISPMNFNGLHVQVCRTDVFMWCCLTSSGYCHYLMMAVLEHPPDQAGADADM